MLSEEPEKRPTLEELERQTRHWLQHWVLRRIGVYVNEQRRQEYFWYNKAGM